MAKDDRVVTMAHGGGGTRMQELLRKTVFPIIGEETLLAEEDAACVDVKGGRLALTTDSFVVKPLFFPGGDIGKLAVCGTVNDLAMRGAEPRFLTLGLILEEGLALETLERVLTSIRRTAEEAGVRLVAGDTKVVERGMADGMYLNTAGVGVISPGREVTITGARPEDAVVVNGYVADHGVAVMSDREAFSFDVALASDCAPLAGLVAAMLDAGEVHSLRDPTRGGLAAAAREMAWASRCAFTIEERAIPVREEARAVCEMLGLDPLYVANEGKLLAAVPPASEAAVLEAMRAHPLGADSAVIGRAGEGRRGEVSLLTGAGSKRLLRMPSGEQLPRIC